MNRELDGKTAIVTGGGSGIGRAISLSFAARGLNITIADMNAESGEAVAREIVQAGGRAIAVRADVSNSADVSAFVERTLAEFGAVSILVNNAGVCRIKRLLDTTDQDLDLIMKSIVYGTILCTREVWRCMREQGFGHIIQICSRAAGWSPADEIIYGTAKTAQLKFSLHLEAEFNLANRTREQSGKKEGHFYTHVICPGSVDTPLNKKIGRTLPKERMLAVEDVAELVLAVAQHPERSWRDWGKEFAGRSYKVIESEMFGQFPNVIRIRKDPGQSGS